MIDVLCANFLNDLANAVDNLGEGDFAIFEIKMRFGNIFYTYEIDYMSLDSMEWWLPRKTITHKSDNSDFFSFSWIRPEEILDMSTYSIIIKFIQWDLVVFFYLVTTRKRLLFSCNNQILFRYQEKTAELFLLTRFHFVKTEACFLVITRQYFAIARKQLTVFLLFHDSVSLYR